MANPEEALVDFIKSSWCCDHMLDGRFTITLDGWCSRCGCVRDDFKITVGMGDSIVSALNGLAFEHRGCRYWYKDALYELGLLEKPTIERRWQPVEEAERKEVEQLVARKKKRSWPWKSE